jgi:ADP-heptose:LPS heptosyltransferase
VQLQTKIKHLAVIRLSAMGDVAMTVPVLRAFAAQYPDIEITMVSRPFFEPLFEGIPNLTFFGVDLDNRHKGFGGLLKLYKDLKKLKIDAIADLHNVLRSKIITALFAIGGTSSVAFNKSRSAKKELVRPEKKIFRPLPTVFEQHLQVFARLGFVLDLKRENIYKPDIDPEVDKLTGEKSGNWIGIAPSAQHPSKVYPADLMKVVVDALSQYPKSKIFIFGSKEEAEILSGFSTAPNIIITAGKLSFRQELQLISQLDVMLSMDSANGHLAAMYRIKVVTLWGSTHPYTGFAPYGQPLHHSLTADREQFPQIPTSIYGNKTVPGYEDAMRTITPESVVEKVLSLLK